MLQRRRGTAGVQRPRARTAACLFHRLVNVLPPGRRGTAESWVALTQRSRVIFGGWGRCVSDSQKAVGCVRAPLCGLVLLCSLLLLPCLQRAGPGLRLLGIPCPAFAPAAGSRCPWEGGASPLCLQVCCSQRQKYCAPAAWPAVHLRAQVSSHCLFVERIFFEFIWK